MAADIDGADAASSGKMIRDAAFQTEILRNMNAFRMTHSFADATLVVHKRRIPVHRVVLAASSQVFAAMFQVDMREKNEGVVDLTCFGIPPAVVDDLLGYLYTGTIMLSADNVEEILSLANFLMMGSLQAVCCSFLESSLQASNCLGIMRIAQKYPNCKRVLDLCRTMIRQEFLMMTESEEFVHMPADFVFDLLSNDDIEVESEDAVFRALMRWVEFDLAKRAKDFRQLLGAVRIQFLDEKYFSTLQHGLQDIPGFKTCDKLIKEACLAREIFHKSKKSDEMLQVGRYIRPRKCLDLTKVLFVTGGYDGNHCLAHSFAFSFWEARWGFLSPMPLSRYDHASVQLNGNVYVLGGFNSHRGPLSRVDCYNPIRDRWDNQANMNSKRKSLAAAIFQGSIYISGGLDENYYTYIFL
jgi:hypothetical protein